MSHSTEIKIDSKEIVQKVLLGLSQRKKDAIDYVLKIGYPQDHPYFSVFVDMYVSGYYSGVDKSLDVIPEFIDNVKVE